MYTVCLPRKQNTDNHITTAPFAYDAAGNETADGAGTYMWNAEGELKTAGVEINLGIGKRAMVDILVRNGHTNYAIELKYKASKLDTVCRGEDFHLLNHGAQDIGRYDFVKDICRLERFVNDHPSTIGYAILLTNDDNYWRQTKRLMTADAMFRLHDNCKLQGALRWGSANGEGTMKGREDPLDLRNSYSVQWADYSELDCEGPRKFRKTKREISKTVGATRHSSG